MKIAILGWGSLLWDSNAAFDEHHEQWQFDGPHLKLEFSRVSTSRNNALTLVLDSANGSACQVAYSFSKRKNPDDTICDLRCREGTSLKNIGYLFSDDSRKQCRDIQVLEDVRTWATENKIDAVVWTDLDSNFVQKSQAHEIFSLPSALSHIQSLDAVGKAKAVEYFWNAPDFIHTPLRDALQSQPWFSNTANS